MPKRKTQKDPEDLPDASSSKRKNDDSDSDDVVLHPAFARNAAQTT
jgi:hypothetical protein